MLKNYADYLYSTLAIRSEFVFKSRAVLEMVVSAAFCRPLLRRLVMVGWKGIRRTVYNQLPESRVAPGTGTRSP